MAENDLSIAVVCSSNQNRSMEAHSFLRYYQNINLVCSSRLVGLVKVLITEKHVEECDSVPNFPYSGIRYADGG